MIMLAVSLVFAIGTGDVHLTASQVLTALRHLPPGLSAGGNDSVPVRIVCTRLPRVALAALVGASLALAGVAFQSLLRNDLADPALVGVSAGASVGSEALLLHGGETMLRGWAVPLAAFFSASAAMTLVYGMARHGGRVMVTSLLLGGVVLSAFLGGVSTLMLTLGSPDDVQRIQYRLNGTFQDATFAQCGIVLVCLVAGLFILFIEARTMNLFALGEEPAQQLGVEVERFKTILVLTGSLLTAATVALAGIIGFVGLIVPHIARLLAGTPDHRRVLPLAVLGGALLLVWADTLARTILPDGRQLPVGLVTAFLGAPFFLYLLRRRLHSQ
jgi:iron complex transport system permease protein